MSSIFPSGRKKASKSRPKDGPGGISPGGRFGQFPKQKRVILAPSPRHHVRAPFVPTSTTLCALQKKKYPYEEPTTANFMLSHSFFLSQGLGIIVPGFEILFTGLEIFLPHLNACPRHRNACPRVWKSLSQGLEILVPGLGNPCPRA